MRAAVGGGRAGSAVRSTAATGPGGRRSARAGPWRQRRSGAPTAAGPRRPGARGRPLRRTRSDGRPAGRSTAGAQAGRQRPGPRRGPGVAGARAGPDEALEGRVPSTQETLDAELGRLGLRKTQLELAMSDPAVAANFVEMRRVTSELADVDLALGEAEDAWLSSRSWRRDAPPRAPPARSDRLTGPIGCGKSQVVRWLCGARRARRGRGQVPAPSPPGHPAHDLVLRRFGTPCTVPTEPSTVPRSAVSCSGPGRAPDLEGIVHPDVRPLIVKPSRPRSRQARRPSRSRRSSWWRAGWRRPATRSGS